MPLCPDCNRPIPGVVTRACPDCYRKRLAALDRPPPTATEGDERPTEPPLSDCSGGKYQPPGERKNRPGSSGRRVIRKGEPFS